MKALPIIAIILALFACGCAQPKPIPSSAVRAPDRIARTGSLESPISQVKSCIDRAEYNCGESGIIVSKNPDDENEFTLRYYGTGGCWPNCPAMIVFTGRGNKTDYVQYALYDFWAKELDAQLRRIESCGECTEN